MMTLLERLVHGKWMVALLSLAIGLAACSGGQQDVNDLRYSTDAGEMIIFADENTTPGGYAIGQECNHIPRLRIWGDGHTVYSDIQDGHRRVLIGQTSPEQIQAILEKLASEKYFSDPPDSTFNRNGTGYRLSIKLLNGDHGSFWSEPNPNYQTVFDTFDPSGLVDFVPQEGFLVVGPHLSKEVFTDPPTWPDRFGFRLGDDTATDQAVTGEALAFLWQSINQQPEPLTGIADGDTIYAVAVFVDGVSLGEPPYRCWNK